MIRIIAFVVSYYSCFLFSFAQTANDVVPPYGGSYRYGSNTSGRTGSWDDVAMANIAAGNILEGQAGAGVRSFRTALPEFFLETWGYNIRISEFNHYASLGMGDHTVFMEGPDLLHRDTSQYCASSTTSSQLFRNLYAPIWDAGTNGTPYNDTNYYAAYVHQLVSTYQSYVKFWEVVNEPDFTSTANGWQMSGVAGNWWDNPPDPCDLDNMLAPIFHYIRMLRISYEVIKSIDPTAYVATGGLGYPSFLDGILRYTDNPGAADGGVGAAGSVQADYPLTGGAYFDCMSYHSYPQYSGRVNGIPKQRHSDAAAWGDIDKKTDFEAVLHTYGYDGGIYPEKVYIITETNISRAKFGNFIGGNEVQRNYVIKSALRCQMNDVRQMYIFSLDDRSTEAAALASHDLMGLFQDLATTPTPYTQLPNDLAIAHKTASDLLYEAVYDPTQTTALALAAGVEGAAFLRGDGTYIYALWAETTLDESEVANAIYSFPMSLGLSFVERFEWDYSQTGTSSTIAANAISLSAAPSFFIRGASPPLAVEWGDINVSLIDKSTARIEWEVFGERASEYFSIERSKDRVIFSDIGTINALDSAVDGTKFTFDDMHPLKGINYYRIRHADIDGKVTFSSIASLIITTITPFSVRLGPNPLKKGEELSIFIEIEGNKIVAGEVRNIVGQNLLSFQYQLLSGTNEVHLPLNNLKNGIFLLNIRLEGNSLTQKFVIIN